MNPCNLIKSVYSVILLIFSIVSVMGLIATKQTNFSSQAHPAAAYVLIWAAIIWLTMVEGGQASLVGLVPVNGELYKDSHPVAYKCTQITNKGDNLDRYLLGRQFMVVLVVFCVNYSGGPIGGAELWGYPGWLKNIFFETGFAMILFTCNVGQLNSQVNASLCMLDYTDNYFALTTLWVSMIIEFSDFCTHPTLFRWFMVVLVVFCVNYSGGPIGGAELWGYPGWLKNIFFETGFAMILFTCNVGQLNSQVNASLCMLDYTDNYFALTTLWVSMIIEFSGLLHSSYLVQMAVSAMAGKKIETNEEPRTGAESLFFYLRCLVSLAVLCFCIAVTMVALFDGKTTMWDGVPPVVAVIIFVVLMSVVGMLEGMQIAFFAVAKIPASERGESVWAQRTCNLLYSGDGNNLPGFMVGRQLCVV
eukprot:CAMPEP_0204641956 /NCGR_PEP_ID=MMETSP0717-20131115/51421_1 /ASSEMBLY_ACC=CAM_ASM_000666 /TAXON_ID=230516 /ORGANISM="Chaetoceros curvisetus" /LENGTH=417 /DNA_ID=CAMNT_0051662687 /DNA_START=979 /DNA_END=2229 /DNA_ORIENTATION=-